MMLKILKQKINTFVLDHTLLPYLITGSKHNGDALPKNYKEISSIPKPATGSTKNTAA